MAKLAMPAPRPTANELFKARWDQWVWSSVIVAVGAHFALFALWPEMSAKGIVSNPTDLEIIEIPDEIILPEPPAELQRPATPVMSNVDVDPDITIADTDFLSNPPEQFLPPPENRGDQGTRVAGLFTPYTVSPNVTNRRALEEALRREYPSTLRDSGIGGTVMVRFDINQAGQVTATRIEASSGYSQLDDAALAVAGVIRFSPALNRDQRVAVSVVFPIVFRVREAPTKTLT